MVKYFEEPALSVSLHPNGLYLLAAFRSGLKVMAILIDDIRPFWESSSFLSCRECRFSHGGHMFATIWNSCIVVCDTWNFDIVANLKATTTKISRIEWSTDDSRILSFSNDGTITRWNIDTKQKEFEIEAPEDIDYLATTLDKSGRVAFVYASDGTIKTYFDGKLQGSQPIQFPVLQSNFN